MIKILGKACEEIINIQLALGHLAQSFLMIGNEKMYKDLMDLAYRLSVVAKNLEEGAGKYVDEKVQQAAGLPTKDYVDNTVESIQEAGKKKIEEDSKE